MYVLCGIHTYLNGNEVHLRKRVGNFEVVFVEWQSLHSNLRRRDGERGSEGWRNELPHTPGSESRAACTALMTVNFKTAFCLIQQTIILCTVRVHTKHNNTGHSSFVTNCRALLTSRANLPSSAFPTGV